jgi:hypothetical protein
MFKLCTSLNYLKLNKNEFACQVGDRDLKSRKLMILMQGSMAVYMPIPPDKMLVKIKEIMA